MQNKKLSPQNSKKEVAISRSITLQNLKKKMSEVNFQTTPLRPFSSNKNSQKGKLYLGKLAKPTVILTRQERYNPYANKQIITQELINHKGIIGLLTMGAFGPETNFSQLLNNQYLIQKDELIIEENDSDTFFATNPLTNMGLSGIKGKQQSLPSLILSQGETLKTESKEKKSTIRKSKSKKIKQVVESNIQFQLKEDKIVLSLINFTIQKNQQYRQFIKKVKANGTQVQYQLLISSMESFSKKYNIKKIHFIPVNPFIKRITDHMLLDMIINHKAFGFDKLVRGNKQEIIEGVARSMFLKYKYKKAIKNILKIDSLKKNYRVRNYYIKMMMQRVKFISFKLSSFIQNQRRYIEDHNVFNPQVQIHIICSNEEIEESKTFYRAAARQRIQLTRLFNSSPQNIILLTNSISQDQDLIVSKSMVSKAKIDIFHCKIPRFELRSVSQIYYGLSMKTIQSIKQICRNKQVALIPYKSSLENSKISQFFKIPLFGGSLTKNSINQLNQRQNLQNEEEKAQINPSIKFTKVITEKDNHPTFTNITKKCVLANELYQNKSSFKKLVNEMNIKSPLCLCCDEMQDEFYNKFSTMIISEKNINKWILKIPNSKFSRGIAFLETDSLKIIKEKKKKTNPTPEDVMEIKNILKHILNEKLIIPHSSLYDSQDFMTEFLQKGGFVQQFLKEAITICLFGRIQPNGKFTLLGTYKKIYTQANIVCAAIYPAPPIYSQVINDINRMAARLFTENVFGYLTFQLLFCQKSRQFYFIDIQTNLQWFSSLYFMYKNLPLVLDPEQSRKFNKTICYCPFIDNNGNQCQSIYQFEEQILNRKLGFDQKKNEGHKFFYLNGSKPDVLGLACFASDQKTSIKMCLQGLSFLISIGGKFNKFQKQFKNDKSDNLYIMDIIWKFRELKKQNQLQV